MSVFLSLTTIGDPAEPVYSAGPFGEPPAFFAATTQGVFSLGQWLEENHPGEEVMCSSSIDFPGDEGVTISRDQFDALIHKGRMSMRKGGVSTAWRDGWHVVDNTDEVHGQLRVDSNENCVCIVGTRTPEWTPDRERHEMAALIAAAPEMLAVLKKAEYVCFDDRTGVLEYFRSVQAVVAKAEPPRTVKRRVNVTYELEIECSPEATASGLMAIAKRSAFIDASSAEAGVKVVDTEVSMVGELYED